MSQPVSISAADRMGGSSVFTTLDRQRSSPWINPGVFTPQPNYGGMNQPNQVGMIPAAGMNTPGAFMQWPGFCNPFMAPFMMQGFQTNPLQSMTVQSVSNTDSSSSVPARTTAVPVVTRQPTASTVTAGTTGLTRQSQSSRSVQPSRSTPTITSERQTSSESDGESDNGQSDDDAMSVGSYERTFEQDQYGVGADEASNTEAMQKLSQLFASTRLDPILKAASEEFGLQVENEEEEECSLRFGGVGVDRGLHDPVMCMPNDIYKERDRLAKSKWHNFPSRVLLDAFRVPKSDHDALFKAPPMDKEVTEILPQKVKRHVSRPVDYCPFWERELVSVDNHLHLLSKLSAFQLTIVNYLLTIIEKDDSPSGVAATANLVNDITVQQLKSALSLSMRSVTLRRENVLANLNKVYVNALPSDLRKLPFAEDSLFGSAFSKTIRSLAKKIKDKKSLEVNLKPLTAFKKKAKSANYSRKGQNPEPQVTGTATRGGRSARGRGRGRGGKRSAPTNPPSAAAGGPPRAKKPRGGRQQQF